MFDKEYLSSSEKLSAFLDGELPQEDVQSLFYEIASDAELQEELRTMVSVKEITKSSMTMPPPALKSSLDSRLGFTQGKPVAMESTAKKSAGAAFFNNRFFLSSMAAIMSAVMMYFIMLPTENAKQLPSDSQMAQVQKIEKPQKADEAAVPVVSSVENDSYSPNVINNNINSSASTVATNEPSQFASSESVSNTNGYDSNINTPLQLSPAKEEISYRDITQASLGFYSPAVKLENNHNYQMTPKEYILNEKKTEILNRFSLEMRYNQGKSYPNLNIPVEAEPIINNVAIGLFYKYNEFNSIGIEFGQENYYQKFFFKEGDLVKRYEQNWMAFWGGLTYNHDFDKIDFLTSMQPYYRFMIGGTQIGPMFRSALGAKIPVSDKMYFVLATEGSYMVYHFQGRSYSSSRLGMSLGFSFGL